MSAVAMVTRFTQSHNTANIDATAPGSSHASSPSHTSSSRSEAEGAEPEAKGITSTFWNEGGGLIGVRGGSGTRGGSGARRGSGARGGSRTATGGGGGAGAD